MTPAPPVPDGPIGQDPSASYAPDHPPAVSIVTVAETVASVEDIA